MAHLSAPRALSSQERRVALGIRAAKSNKEIAYEMDLSMGTVKEYVHEIFLKLGMPNRTAVALWAAEHLREETQCRI